MSKNDDLIKDLAAQREAILPSKPKNKGGRPRKPQRKSPSIKNKRIRRMETIDLDLTACAAALHAAAELLHERIFEDQLTLHYDFRSAMANRIRGMQELAVGMGLHRDNPSETAYKTLQSTQDQLVKEVETERARKAKERAMYPHGRLKTDIQF